MLPDADDFPSLPAKLAVHAPVAGHIVFALFVPEFPVGFGTRVALGAAVPEASVDEDGDLFAGECKVGLSGQCNMSSPAGEVSLPQQ